MGGTEGGPCPAPSSRRAPARLCAPTPTGVAGGSVGDRGRAQAVGGEGSLDALDVPRGWWVCLRRGAAGPGPGGGRFPAGSGGSHLLAGTLGARDNEIKGGMPGGCC